MHFKLHHTWHRQLSGVTCAIADFCHMQAQKEVKSSNLIGEGLILGGLMVMRAGTGGPQFIHIETVSYEMVLPFACRGGKQVAKGYKT